MFTCIFLYFLEFLTSLNIKVYVNILILNGACIDKFQENVLGHF
jgi:hypothetical protein